MHQFGWLSERGSNFFNLFQKERGTQKGGVDSNPGKLWPNILRLGQVRDTKFGTNVSNKMLPNAVKC